MPRASNFTEAQKAKLFVKHRATCVYCGAKLWILDGGANPYFAIDWADHLVPVAKGGLSTLKNGVCSCYECNHAKSDRSKAPAFLFDEGDRLPRRLARFNKLHESDWYFNRSLFRLLLGVHYLFNGVGVRTRDDRHYAAAALKAMKKWQRAVSLGNVPTLEVRGLAPIKPSKDKKLMLGLRNAKSVADIRQTMRKLLPSYSAKTCAQWKPDDASTKPVQPNEKLALVVGSKPLPRTELTKKLWDYIQRNGLQDKKVKTRINADAALLAVFGGKKRVSLDEMVGLVCLNTE
ncbi:MAG: hypothetical protein PCFJNLEI_01368 [Verrucomicrobiae bacterium]|nr:hypothetical protein [Verrucomicrobiae bacterium]